MPSERNWFGLGAAECRDVNAPCDVLWEVVTDIDRYPFTLTTVKAIERLDGSDTGTTVIPGTKWRQIRESPQGYEVVAEMTVRAIEDSGRSEGCFGSYRKSLTATGNFEGRGISTITLTVESSDETGNNGSRLVATFGLVPDSFPDKVAFFFLGGYLDKKARVLLCSDLYDIAAEAERISKENHANSCVISDTLGGRDDAKGD